MNITSLIQVWLLICTLSLCVCDVDLGEGEDVEDHGIDDWDNVIMNGTVYKQAKRYFCAVNPPSNLQDGDAYQLVNGLNMWTFPRQDVSLNLSYPVDEDHSEYVITSIEVLLYLDGTQSQGYVTRGGVTRDNISLTFKLHNITILGYRFKLRGFRKNNFESDSIPDDDQDTPVAMCDITSRS